jgi:hypothetical protein
MDWCEPQTVLSFFTEEIFKDPLFSGFERVVQSGRLHPQALISEKSYFHKWPLTKSFEALALYPARPEKVQLLEVMDSLVLKAGGQGQVQYWPDLLLPAVIRQVIKKKVSTLDLRFHVYIIAQDLWIRPLAAAAVNLGFSQIVLVGTDQEFLKNQKAYLSKKLIGVHFEVVLTHDLTLQTQQAGLVMNCIDLQKSKESLQDIAYFNFMVPEGLFLDFMEGPSHKLLRDEADRAHLISIQAFDLEMAWWRQALLNN